MDSNSLELTRKWKEAKDKISAENTKKRRRIEFVLATKPATSSSASQLTAQSSSLEQKKTEAPKVTAQTLR
jgi:hypothetical protein